MRIQNTNFLLTLVLEHTTVDNSNVMNIDAYGSDFKPLPLQRTIEGNRETIEISICMPNTIMLVLFGKNYQTDKEKSVRLLEMSLAGIKINNTILFNSVIDYRPTVEINPPESIQELLNNPSTDPILWNHNGCVLFNLFDPDPFAYHMYIGNQIKF
jgi:hypothetical protein